MLQSAETTSLPEYSGLATAALRAQLATLLRALTALPGSPQAVVLRGRAEELDAAVAGPVPDPVEVDRRRRRLSDAITLVAPSGSELAGITSSVGVLALR